MNVTLNSGGILGGFLAAGIGIACCAAGNQKGMSGLPQVLVMAVIVGALGGNFLWSVVVGKPDTERATGVATSQVFRILRKVDALERRGEFQDAVEILESALRENPGVMAKDMLERRLARLQQRLPSATPPNDTPQHGAG